jgi:hypothetical protein
MRIDRRVSPNQTALWTLYELHNGAGQRPAVVRLACYYGRSTEVNGGHPGHSSVQVRALDNDHSPFFQAGHTVRFPSPAQDPRRPRGVLPASGNTPPVSTTLVGH